MEDRKPVLLLWSCSSRPAAQVLHDVFGELQSASHGHYEWPVVTKYYTADVEICPMDKDQAPSQTLLDVVEALLVYYDPQEDTVEESLDRKLNATSLSDLEVKVLAVNKFTADAKSPRDVVQRWCLEGKYELVELFPEEFEEDDEDVIGPQRVKKALEVHTWSNLKKKAPDGGSNGGLLDEMGDFENLFSSFAEMKKEAEKLPPSERKAYAEKVAVAFWKAMNLDDDEVDGLDDSDEDSDTGILNEILDGASYSALQNEKE